MNNRQITEKVLKEMFRLSDFVDVDCDLLKKISEKAISLALKEKDDEIRELERKQGNYIETLRIKNRDIDERNTEIKKAIDETEKKLCKFIDRIYKEGLSEDFADKDIINCIMEEQKQKLGVSNG